MNDYIECRICGSEGQTCFTPDGREREWHKTRQHDADEANLAARSARRAQIEDRNVEL